MDKRKYKTWQRIGLLLVLGLLSAACEKKVPPTVSGLVLEEVSPAVIKVTADVSGRCDSVALCLSTTEVTPTSRNAQTLGGQLQGGEFTALTGQLVCGEVYYFSIEAINEYGVTHSETKSLKTSYRSVGPSDNPYPGL